MSVTDTLNQALIVLDECGWIQFAHGDTKKGFCLNGVLRHVTDLRWSAVYRFDSPEWIEYAAARTALVEEIKREPLAQYSSIAEWNDAPFRTYTQVRKLIQSTIERQS